MHADNAALRTSDVGLELIERFEGFEPDWYLDAVGVRTIAFGWTGALPDGYAPPLTRAQGRRLLRETIGRYEDAVRRSVDVPLAQPQFDALVSFTYNLGAGSLKASTLLKVLNAGDAGAAAEQFDRWVLAGGRPLPGLVRRRAAERALFASAIEPPEPHAEEPEPRAEAPHAEEAEPQTETPAPPADPPRGSDPFERLPPKPPHIIDP